MSGAPWDEAAFEQAVRLFNRRAFFECHEVWEDLWRPLPPGPPKQFLQGLIQTAVGFHHLQNRNYTGAKNLLAAGLDKLQAVQVEHFQAPVDLSAFIPSVQECLDTVRALGPTHIGAFPPPLIPRLPDPASPPPAG